jgi:hypothetical protein
MLKVEAWPYPLFEAVQFTVKDGDVKYEDLTFNVEHVSKGYVVAARQLRERSTGDIELTMQITTSASEVVEAVFGSKNHVTLTAGIRILCEESKFRAFVPVKDNQKIVTTIPLQKVRGVVQIVPMFVVEEDAVAKNGMAVQRGTVVGTSADPIFVTIDEDWTGETIPVDWLDFAERGLPSEGFMHIELSGGSQVPRVWLNAKYRNQIDSVLLRKGDASVVGLAGAGMREFFWMQVWGEVLVWSLDNESEEHEKWPATRIANFWRSRFSQNCW